MLNTYPPAKRQKIQKNRIIEYARWPFLMAAILLPIINLLTGTPWWSVIAVFGLWVVWNMLFATQLVEYNRISNTVKLITYTAIMLLLIYWLLDPKWEGVINVIAIVSFSGVTLLGILFFSNLHKQRHNLFPLLLFIVAVVAFGVTGIIIWRGRASWEFITLLSTGVAFLVTTAIVLRKDLLREFAKRFHTK
jgi:hypothetical protein